MENEKLGNPYCKTLHSSGTYPHEQQMVYKSLGVRCQTDGNACEVTKVDLEQLL